MPSPLVSCITATPSSSGTGSATTGVPDPTAVDRDHVALTLQAFAIEWRSCTWGAATLAMAGRALLAGGAGRGWLAPRPEDCFSNVPRSVPVSPRGVDCAHWGEVARRETPRTSIITPHLRPRARPEAAWISGPRLFSDSRALGLASLIQLPRSSCGGGARRRRLPVLPDRDRAV